MLVLGPGAASTAIRGRDSGEAVLIRPLRRELAHVEALQPRFNPQLGDSAQDAREKPQVLVDIRPKVLRVPPEVVDQPVPRGMLEISDDAAKPEGLEQRESSR